MDKITKSLLSLFVEEESLGSATESEAFEHFGNYTVLSNNYSDQFDISDVHAGSGNDTGIDGIGIIVNGTLITSKDEVDDLLATNRYLDVVFYFIQAKTSSSFDVSEFGTFTFGVADFFSDTPSMVRSETVDFFAKIQEYIFSKSIYMTRGKPECKLFYVTTGKWVNDKNFVSRMDASKRDLEQLNLFKNVEIYPIDADKLYQMYNNTKNKVKTEIQFQSKITLPDTAGVQQAYLGVLPTSEYFKLIIDESGL